MEKEEEVFEEGPTKEEVLANLNLDEIDELLDGEVSTYLFWDKNNLPSSFLIRILTKIISLWRSIESNGWKR